MGGGVEDGGGAEKVEGGAEYVVGGLLEGMVGGVLGGTEVAPGFVDGNGTTGCAIAAGTHSPMAIPIANNAPARKPPEGERPSPSCLLPAFGSITVKIAMQTLPCALSSTRWE